MIQCRLCGVSVEENETICPACHTSCGPNATDEALTRLTDEIYWHIEHGERRQAVAKLRKLLNTPQHFCMLCGAGINDV